MGIIDCIVKISEMRERERGGGRKREKEREREGAYVNLGPFLNYSCEVEEGRGVELHKGLEI